MLDVSMVDGSMVDRSLVDGNRVEAEVATKELSGAQLSCEDTGSLLDTLALGLCCLHRFGPETLLLDTLIPHIELGWVFSRFVMIAQVWSYCF